MSWKIAPLVFIPNALYFLINPQLSSSSSFTVKSPELGISVFPINFCVTYMFLLENVIGKFKAFILSILAILIGLLISIIVSVSMIQIPLIFK